MSAIVIIFTTLFWFLFFGIIGINAFMWYHNKRKHNPYDLWIVELLGDSMRTRHGMGRFIMHPEKGRVLVEVGFMPKSTKTILGTHFSEEDSIVSSTGKKRATLIVCVKDHISSPVKRALEDKELSNDEKKLLNTLVSNNTIKLEEVPKNLNLKPIQYEQTNFYLQTQKDALKLHNDSDKKFSRLMVGFSLGIFGLLVIGSIVIIVLLITQSPQFASTLADQASTNGGAVGALLPG